MITAGDITAYLSELAPPALAESYDNVGLLVGAPAQEVTKAVIALDITSAVIDEAVGLGAQLIISHHPVIFHPVKKLPSQGRGAIPYKLARYGLSALCMHTNLDIADGGVNDCLAEVLGVEGCSVLDTTGSAGYKKIVVFVPITHAEKLRQAMAEAGAGRYGLYDSCAFETKGRGSFRPLPGAKPYTGCINKIEFTDETRLEVVCEAAKVNQVVAAMKLAHPYELPAYDIFEDEALGRPYGIGRVGDLPQPMSLEKFAELVKERLHCGSLRAILPSPKEVKRVALCGGAADESLTEAAVRKNADILLVGEMKHSAMVEARELGQNVLIAGHFATEDVICTRLQSLLSQRFSGCEFIVAKSNTDPASTL